MGWGSPFSGKGPASRTGSGPLSWALVRVAEGDLEEG